MPTGASTIAVQSVDKDVEEFEMSIQTEQVLALLALWLIALSINVSRLRLRYKVSFGDDGHKDLMVAIRVHGNALEQSLLMGMLLLALETKAGSGAAVIACLGIVFLIARLLHALAAFQRWLLPRQVAHVASLAMQLVAAVLLLT